MLYSCVGVACASAMINIYVTFMRSSDAGPNLDGASLYRCVEDFGVTVSAAVPTVWLGLLNHLNDNKLTVTTLKRTVVGGTHCLFQHHIWSAPIPKEC
jgi:hypothetical protein